MESMQTNNASDSASNYLALAATTVAWEQNNFVVMDLPTK